MVIRNTFVALFSFFSMHSSEVSSEQETDEWMNVNGALVRLPIDMADDMLSAIVAISVKCGTEFDLDKQGQSAAEYIKRKLDERFAPHWHVTIGNSFGSYVIHEGKKFVYFYLNKRAFLIYKMGQ